MAGEDAHSLSLIPICIYNFVYPTWPVCSAVLINQAIFFQLVVFILKITMVSVLVLVAVCAVCAVHTADAKNLTENKNFLIVKSPSDFSRRMTTIQVCAIYVDFVFGLLYSCICSVEQGV